VVVTPEGTHRHDEVFPQRGPAGMTYFPQRGPIGRRCYPSEDSGEMVFTQRGPLAKSLLV
jgi:hypothetical protein